MAAMSRGRPGDALRAAAWVGQALVPSCRWEGAILHVTILVRIWHHDERLCCHGGASKTADQRALCLSIAVYSSICV